MVAIHRGILVALGLGLLAATLSLPSARAQPNADARRAMAEIMLRWAPDGQDQPRGMSVTGRVGPAAALTRSSGSTEEIDRLQLLGRWRVIGRNDAVEFDEFEARVDRRAAIDRVIAIEGESRVVTDYQVIHELATSGPMRVELNEDVTLAEGDNGELTLRIELVD